MNFEETSIHDDATRNAENDGPPTLFNDNSSCRCPFGGRCPPSEPLMTCGEMPENFDPSDTTRGPVSTPPSCRIASPPRENVPPGYSALSFGGLLLLVVRCSWTNRSICRRQSGGPDNGHLVDFTEDSRLHADRSILNDLSPVSVSWIDDLITAGALVVDGAFGWAAAVPGARMRSRHGRVKHRLGRSIENTKKTTTVWRMALWQECFQNIHLDTELSPVGLWTYKTSILPRSTRHASAFTAAVLQRVRMGTNGKREA